MSAQVFGTPGLGAWNQVAEGIDAAYNQPTPVIGNPVKVFNRFVLIPIPVAVVSVLLALLLAISGVTGGVLALVLFVVVAAVLFSGVAFVYSVLRRLLSPNHRSTQVIPPANPVSVGDAIAAYRHNGDSRFIPDDVMSWAVGARAEENVGQVLGSLDHRYQVAHHIEILDEYLGVVRANIDHLLTGPQGTIMVDTKRWSGTLRSEGGTFTCDGIEASARIRQEAPDTLRWEASQVPSGVDAIIVSVDGPGRVEGHLIALTNPGSIPIYAVRTDDLIRLIGSLPKGNAAEMAAILHSPNLNLPN